MITKSAVKPQPRRQLLDPESKEWMLAVLIRNLDAFQSVRGRLFPSHLQSITPGHAAIWEVVLNGYADQGILPDQGLLEAMLKGYIADNPDWFGEDETLQVEKFLDFAYAIPDHSIDSYKSYSLKVARRFLEEQLSLQLHSRLMQNQTVPASLPAVLSEYMEASVGLVEFGQDTSSLVFPEGWDTQQRQQLISTSIPVIDQFLGGGHVGPEVMGFLGPYGSCKTIVAVQLVAGGAHHCVRLAAEHPEEPHPVVVFISTELPVKQFRERIMSCLARIPRKTLARMESIESLGNGAPQAYEQKYFRKYIEAGTGFRTERQRALEAVQLVNQHVLFVEFLDSNPACSSLLGEGIAGISLAVDAMLRRHAREVGKECRPTLFVLDHASALANYIVRKRHLRVEENRSILRDIPISCRDMMAIKYNTPFWVMHQLAADSNKRNPTTMMHHAEAAECRSFAEFLDFAVTTGVPDTQQLARIDCTKHRREPPKAAAVIKINGAFARIYDVSNDYYIDDGSRTFFSVNDRQKIRDEVRDRIASQRQREAVND